MSDGTDIAQVALVNGAARAKPDAPDPYKEQEVAAQAARRGIWVNLPPPPDTIKHPIVQDTATIAGNGRVYPLDGIIGLGQPYAGQLQGYITGAGDSLTCAVQQASGTYICLLPDGTDIAKAALVNGAARVAGDAPDAYRVQQLDALNNRRGFWTNPPADAITLAASEPDQYAFAAGDDGVDGITYVGGAPTAMIDGEEVFLVLGAGALGWGYYDHWHHWRGAPDRYRHHLEHFHPEGRGLRGYRSEAMLHRDGGFRHDEMGHREAPGERREAPGERREALGERREAPGERREALGRPGGMPNHPGMDGARPGMAQHPGMSGAMAHPGMAGGGFVHPGPLASSGGFHPGAPAAGAMHAAPAVHAAAASGGKHR
jgi:endonuclease YncB( thermonuclease family)